jgi:hypothetical protein
MRGIGEFVFIGAQNAGMIGWYRRRFFMYRCSLAIIGCAAAATVVVLRAVLCCLTEGQDGHL